MIEKKSLIIVGSGPAGYTAAIYAARANLAPILFEGFYSGPAGGQLMTTTEVENYPGFAEGISGPQLMQICRKQAERFGTEIVAEDVERVDLTQRPFTVYGSHTTLQTEALILATGATAKRLDIPGTREGEFWGKGVTACAVCDGAMPIFRNKPLYVIGGGDSAVEEGIFLTRYASRVFIVHRRDQLRASKIMASRALNHPKIEIIWDSVVCAVHGDAVVNGITIQNVKTGHEEFREAGGLFFAIGHTPNTKFLNGQLDLHDNGYIRLKQTGGSYTSVEGVFAAGDVHDFVYRQAITAAGAGCVAALDAERWLTEKGHIA